MTTVATYHPSGTAKAGKQPALRVQTFPMLYSDAMLRSHYYQLIFKKIRRKFAVFPWWRGIKY